MEGNKLAAIQLGSYSLLAAVGHISLKGIVIVELNGVVVILFCLH